MVGRLLEGARLPSRYDHCTLDSYRPQTDLQRKALAVMRGFVDAYPAGERGLMFLGGCGVGMTHLPVAALRDLIREKGDHVRGSGGRACESAQARAQRDTTPAWGWLLCVPPSIDTTVIEEVFRRLLLSRLRAAHRLSEEFHQKLLSWHPSGFSLHAEQLVAPHEPDRLARLVRYLVRPPLATGRVTRTPQGRVLVATPPDPRTGEREQLLDPLDWIHRLTQHIPDPRSHTIRYYGAYSNRLRSSLLGTGKPAHAPPSTPPQAPQQRTPRASGARRHKKGREVDPHHSPPSPPEKKVG